MQNHSPALTAHVPLDTLQSLQERFARLGQMSVCICDRHGNAVTRPTWGSRYSQLIGESPRGRDEFLVGLRRCTADGPADRIILILEGMRLYAAPIEYDGTRLAFIVVGTRPADAPAPEMVRNIARDFDIDPLELLGAAEPEFAWTGGTPEAIHGFADLLADTVATLYGQSCRIGNQLRDLQVVHGLADLLAGTFDLPRILDTTVRRVVDVMPVKACAIRLLNEDTGELVIKAVCNLSDEYLNKGPVIIHENQIDAAAFAGKTVYIEDAPNDPRIRYRENARREGIVSGLCVPMTYSGRTIGVMRVYTAKKYRFSDSQAQLLHSIASQSAAAVIHQRLFAERAEAERVQRQVDAAGQIQRRMLPAPPGAWGRLQFGCVSDPTLELGGDFYDFLPLRAEHLGVCIADVVGKGLPAALLMASVRSALRAYAGSLPGKPSDEPAIDLASTLVNVNRQLSADTLPSEFATLFLAGFSPDGKVMTYCNAGHAAPLLFRDGRFIPLDAGGMVIGVRPDEPYEQDTLGLRPDDILVMVTDGVTDAMDFQGRTYGWPRLQASIRRHSTLAARPLARQLLWDVRRFAGLAEQSDDITIVVAKW